MAETNWRPLALAAAIGATLYAGSSRTATPPAKTWDIAAWSRQAPATPTPAPPVAPPAAPKAPVAVVPPLPPVVATPPTIKEPRKRQRRQKVDRQSVDRAPKPAPPQRQVTTEPERLPTCAQVCAYVSGKTRQQLQAESAGMTISPRLLSHGMACYARCRK